MRLDVRCDRDNADCCVSTVASPVSGVQLASRGKRDISTRVKDVVLSLALCHNVSSSHQSTRRWMLRKVGNIR